MLPGVTVLALTETVLSFKDSVHLFSLFLLIKGTCIFQNVHCAIGNVFTN
jgi:hypothetical protein